MKDFSSSTSDRIDPFVISMMSTTDRDCGVEPVVVDPASLVADVAAVSYCDKDTCSFPGVQARKVAALSRVVV
jgi:hypothetical protein